MPGGEYAARFAFTIAFDFKIIYLYDSPQESAQCILQIYFPTA
jgi:hypothetical protein